MSERRDIFGLSFRIVAGLVAVVGLILLFVPGIARGLVASGKPAPWSLRPHETPQEARPSVLEAAGVRVSAARWRANRRLWDDMADIQRKDMLARLARVQAFDPDRRRTLADRYKSLQELPEKEREQLRLQASALARFEASLSRQDRAVLDSLPPTHRARRIVDLWRHSQGLD